MDAFLSRVTLPNLPSNREDVSVQKPRPPVLSPSPSDGNVSITALSKAQLWELISPIHPPHFDYTFISAGKFWGCATTPSADIKVGYACSNDDILSAFVRRDRFFQGRQTIKEILTLNEID